MSHPPPNLGSSQRQILAKLAISSQPYQEVPEDHLQRAVEKLYQKGYVKFQATGNKKHWGITEKGIKALNHQE